ncbi:hypothetical protein [Clavibacter michiganensis]|uniref:Uncharacterized protein n=1 Tax=Clavibacter michiganensis TaxID=28447 RepID=A0A251YKD5_9MICO|nr:hypothetical protein [Clavibacter michiganensis]OUE24694.1 hypothetical protein BFL37_07810 [Clavibacter michiganensis]
MTADDTTADRAAAEDPGHGRRELAAVGLRAMASWITEVITRRRLLVTVGVGLAAGTAMTLLIHPVLARADGEDGSIASAALLGLFVGVAAGVVPVSIWLTRAIRRHPSVTGTHPSWRDAGLLEAAVDSRGRVTLAPGTAERVATESRRVIASSAVGVPGAVALGLVALLALPTYVISGEAGTFGWFMPIYLVMSASTLWSQSLAAGRMALLRDAADAELALPESERSVAPPVEPPHGSRLP